MKYIISLKNAISKKILVQARQLIKTSHFLHLITKSVFNTKFFFKRLGSEMYNAFFLSIPIISLTSLFAGAVLALQFYYGLKNFGAETVLPTVVSLALLKELSPVLTALMFVARYCSSSASQMTSMKNQNQFDVLNVSGISPYDFVIKNKIIASVLSLPILTVIADIIGIFGGFVVCSSILKFTKLRYISNIYENIKISDLTFGIKKSIIFAISSAIITAYFSVFSKNGSEGVGKATTNTVVVASISVFLLNYLLTYLFSS